MDDQILIDTGPYRLIRHPMYAGALLMFVGTFALVSWWGLAAFPLMVGMLVWRLTAEERFLVEQLAGYSEYRSRVRWRLAPGLTSAPQSAVSIDIGARLRGMWADL